eukprot:Gb_00748 [translate_table: standard]
MGRFMQLQQFQCQLLFWFVQYFQSFHLLPKSQAGLLLYCECFQEQNLLPLFGLKCPPTRYAGLHAFLLLCSGDYHQKKLSVVGQHLQC